MGACVSNHEQLLNQMSKEEIQKLIIESLQNYKNNETRAEITALLRENLAAAKESTTAHASGEQAATCSSCKCNCHLNRCATKELREEAEAPAQSAHHEAKPISIQEPASGPLPSSKSQAEGLPSTTPNKDSSPICNTLIFKIVQSNEDDDDAPQADEYVLDEIEQDCRNQDVNRIKNLMSLRNTPISKAMGNKQHNKLDLYLEKNERARKAIASALSTVQMINRTPGASQNSNKKTRMTSYSKEREAFPEGDVPTEFHDRDLLADTDIGAMIDFHPDDENEIEMDEQAFKNKQPLICYGSSKHPVVGNFVRGSNTNSLGKHRRSYHALNYNQPRQAQLASQQQHRYYTALNHQDAAHMQPKSLLYDSECQQIYSATSINDAGALNQRQSYHAYSQMPPHQHQQAPVHYLKRIKNNRSDYENICDMIDEKDLKMSNEDNNELEVAEEDMYECDGYADDFDFDIDKMEDVDLSIASGNKPYQHLVNQHFYHSQLVSNANNTSASAHHNSRSCKHLNNSEDSSYLNNVINNPKSAATSKKNLKSKSSIMNDNANCKLNERDDVCQDDDETDTREAINQSSDLVKENKKLAQAKAYLNKQHQSQQIENQDHILQANDEKIYEKSGASEQVEETRDEQYDEEEIEENDPNIYMNANELFSFNANLNQSKSAPKSRSSSSKAALKSSSLSATPTSFGLFTEKNTSGKSNLTANKKINNYNSTEKNLKFNYNLSNNSQQHQQHQQQQQKSAASSIQIPLEITTDLIKYNLFSNSSSNNPSNLKAANNNFTKNNRLARNTNDNYSNYYDCNRSNNNLSQNNSKSFSNIDDFCNKSASDKKLGNSRANIVNASNVQTPTSCSKSVHYPRCHTNLVSDEDNLTDEASNVLVSKEEICCCENEESYENIKEISISVHTPESANKDTSRQALSSIRHQQQNQQVKIKEKYEFTEHITSTPPCKLPSLSSTSSSSSSYRHCIYDNISNYYIKKQHSQKEPAQLESDLNSKETNPSARRQETSEETSYQEDVQNINSYSSIPSPEQINVCYSHDKKTPSSKMNKSKEGGRKPENPDTTQSASSSPSFPLMSKGGKGKLTSETSGQLQVPFSSSTPSPDSRAQQEFEQNQRADTELFYYADDTDIGELSQSLDRIEMLEDKVKSIRNQINVKLAEQQSAKIAEKAIPEDTPSDLSLSQSESAKLEPDQKRGSLVASKTTFEKLKLQNIVEAVGHFMFPTSGFLNRAFKELLIQHGLYDSFKQTFTHEFQKLFNDLNETNEQRFAPPCENLVNRSINYLLTSKANSKNTIGLEEFQKRLGKYYFKYLFEEFEKPLQSIGGTMHSFFNNLNSLHESLINHEYFGSRFIYLNEKYTGYAPSFRCEITKIKKESAKVAYPYELVIFTIQENVTPFLVNFYGGLVEATAETIWSLDVQVTRLSDNKELAQSLKLLSETSDSNQQFKPDNISNIIGYRVEFLSTSANADYLFFGEELSSHPQDLIIDADMFKSTFPFTIVIDRQMNIKQVGDGLLRHLGQLIKSGLDSKFLTYFSIESPKLNDYTFESLVLNLNMSYKLKLKSDTLQNSKLTDMEIKGSIIYVEESDCLIFIGSPVINCLEELTGRGLYISDIPIHDAARDIILVGEQTKAQEGLKFRMELLKKSVVQAHEDIEDEKRKNIELLNLIFPSDIAKKLWMGEKVAARSVVNVTLLYSDIVGFTSICGSAQPIEVVEMLKSLYTDFDNYCGLLDIYKIETIGDAYVAAGGLHKPSVYHAQRIAWMSLLMMFAANRNYTHQGEKIKIRIGLHTGDVLAGIVGFKQPRYCLFGNDCTIANKFESMSEEKRIHVSPVTKTFLDVTEGFEFEPRSPEFLPENFQVKTGEEPLISWFLNAYHHKDVDPAAEVLVHVQAAIKEIDSLSQENQ